MIRGKEMAMSRELTAPGFRRFVLERLEDVNGMSGTGIVAYGVEFPTGRAVMQWRPTVEIQSGATGLYDSVGALVDIHGHGGRSVVRFLDPDELPFFLSSEMKNAVADEILRGLVEG